MQKIRCVVERITYQNQKILQQLAGRVGNPMDIANMAKYAVGTSNEPIGISEYELLNLLPKTDKIEEKLSEDPWTDDGSEE